MGRPRKRHVQQALLTLSGQPRRDGRGGPRRGAGRKPKNGVRAGSPHKTRPVVKGRFPIHAVMRIEDDIRNLRKRHLYQALRWATIAVARRERHDAKVGYFRIIHISIQRDHIHMIIEAGDKTALSRGMQSFQISAAKHLNAAITLKSATPRRGRVFTDRYHAELITTPRQARNTLAYVLNNWRKHREDDIGVTRSWNVDPFSTGILFEGWREREDQPLFWRMRDTYEPLVVHLPKTWLLYEGWRKHGGGTIPFAFVPGRTARTARTAAMA